MRFLKLLDPYAAAEGSGLSVGAQQELARKHFPDLVVASRLNLWTFESEVAPNGYFVVVGLAASHDLKDLRLADLMNEALSGKPSFQINVFDMSHLSADEVVKHFPVECEVGPLLTRYPPNPLVGIWKDLKLIDLQVGFEARKAVLEILGSSVSAEDSVRGLAPPDPSLLEG